MSTTITATPFASHSSSSRLVSSSFLVTSRPSVTFAMFYVHSYIPSPYLSRCFIPWISLPIHAFYTPYVIILTVLCYTVFCSYVDSSDICRHYFFFAFTFLYNITPPPSPFITFRLCSSQSKKCHRHSLLASLSRHCLLKRAGFYILKGSVLMSSDHQVISSIDHLHFRNFRHGWLNFIYKITKIFNL